MQRINTGRLLLGTLVAGIFYFIADGIVHGKILSADYVAAMTAAGKEIKQDPTAYGYFAIFDLGKGLVAMLFYAMARARLGPGVKTAVWAGLFAWFACEFVPAVPQMPFPFFTKIFFCKVMALELVPMIIGAILGAWVYKEPSTAA